MNAELPTIKEELTRKTVDELQRLLLRRSSGRMTNSQFKAAIETMFEICSGIVDQDFFEMITLASEEIEQDFSFKRRRLFRGPGKKFRMLSYDMEKGTILLVDLKPTNSTSKSMDATEPEKLLDKVDGIVKKLTASDFFEV